MKSTLSHSIEAAHVKEVSEVMVLEFFETLRHVVEQHDIQPKDIYNMDETGLPISKIKLIRGFSMDSNGKSWVIVNQAT